MFGVEALYGCLEPTKREWTDGLLSRLPRMLGCKAAEASSAAAGAALGGSGGGGVV